MNVLDIQPTRNTRLVLVAKEHLLKLTNAIVAGSGLQESMLNLLMVLDTAKSVIVLKTYTTTIKQHKMIKQKKRR